jgi:hypothetical protein
MPAVITGSINPLEPARRLLRSGKNDSALETLGGIPAGHANYWPAQRLIADAHFQNRDWPKALAALEAMLNGAGGAPSDLVLRARILANMKRYQDAINQLAHATQALGETADILNLYKVCHFNLGDEEKAIACGQAAIDLRDRECSGETVPVTLTRNAGDKDVIAFSLWGARDAYCAGAVINALICRYVYPNWVARFYVAPDVPDQIVRELKDAGAEVVTGDPEIPSYWWRFMIMNDPGVRRFLCRDTDSRLTSREAALVDDWIESDRGFHIIRDHILHNDLILAGMWGGHATDSIVLRDLMAGRATNKYGGDQRFLAEEIWPRVKGSVYVNDSYYATPLIPSQRGKVDPGFEGIGAGYQNDASVRRELARLRGEHQ